MPESVKSINEYIAKLNRLYATGQTSNYISMAYNDSKIVIVWLDHNAAAVYAIKLEDAEKVVSKLKSGTTRQMEIALFGALYESLDDSVFD
jgi:hypothetical protein